MQEGTWRSNGIGLFIYGKQIGVNLNSKKTKTLRVCTSGKCVLPIDGKQITEVDSNPESKRVFQYCYMIVRHGR